MKPPIHLQSDVRYSLAFVVAMALCAVIGSRLLIAVAPWHVTEIYVVSAVSLLAGLGLWRVGRDMPWIRQSLLGATVILLAALGAGCYRFFMTHYLREFPPLHGRFLPGALGGGGWTSDEPSAKELQAIKERPATRSRLLALLPAAVADANLMAEAESILQSRYALDGYPAAQLPRNLAWTEDPYGDRSWNFSLHNLDYVVTLTRAYEKSGKAQYLQRAELLAMDWIADNTRYMFNAPSEFSWNDHTTALRLINLLYFFDIWKSSSGATTDRMTIVLRSMLGHAAMLSDDRFYSHEHNHGIDQDRALLAFSLMHPYFRQSAQWQTLALDRLTRQVRFAVSPHGIHLEHSAGYHLYGMMQLQGIRAFLELWGVRHEVLDALRHKIRLMAEYAPYLVKPDGYVVQLGDTEASPITAYRDQLAAVARASPELLELIDSGSSQRARSLAKAFPEEGYAIIRDTDDGSLDFRSSFYLFFAAGAHERRAHRQADDLSFVLSYRGHELLVDPGVYSYKQDAGRDYVTSTAAHNTVSVDGRSYTGWDTHLDRFVTTEQYTLIRASHRNYPGLEHTRWLLYLRPALLVVVDRIVPTPSSGPSTSHRFEQLFHFAPGLAVTISGADNGVEIFAEDSVRTPLLHLLQLSRARPEMRIARGEREPMQGWHSQEHATLVPAPTVVSSVSGRDAEFVTVLQLYREKATVDDHADRETDFRATSDQRTLVVTGIQGARSFRVSLDLQTSDVSLD